MYATYPHMRHYQTLGDVWIDFYKQRGKTVFKKDQGGLLSVQHESVEVQTYNRELDISRAVGKIQYESEKGKYEREFFASNPDHIIVYQMKSVDGELLNFDLFLTRKETDQDVVHLSVMVQKSWMAIKSVYMENKVEITGLHLNCLYR